MSTPIVRAALEAEPEGSTMAVDALVALERIQHGDVSHGSDDFDLVANALGQLRRWGTPTTPPTPEPPLSSLMAQELAEAEQRHGRFDASETIERLGRCHSAMSARGDVQSAALCQHAATLLQQQATELVALRGVSDAEALAARPLLERVARLGDCISQQTVGQITAISARAAAWLRDNPPGQPVAIEPRGCPMPGACSCVEPAPPAPVPLHGYLQGYEAGRRDAAADAQQAADAAQDPPAPEPELGGLEAWLKEEAEAYRNTCGINLASKNLDKAATPLQQQATELVALRGVPVAVSERPWEQKGWCDERGRCWWTAGKQVSLPPVWWLVSIPQSCTDGVMLPAHAISLPAPQAGEGEA